MIKKILLVSLIFGTSLVYSQFQTPISEILKKEGYYYSKEDYLLNGDKTTKFSGKVYQLFSSGFKNPPGTFSDEDDWKDYMKDSSHNTYIGRELNILNGLLHGSYKHYDVLGNIRREFTYEFGILEGPYKQYCPTGEVKVSVDYRNGKKNGDYRSFHCLTNKDG